MRCRRVFVWIGAMLTVFFITGLLSAYLIAKPIKLDEKEITYYTSVAKKAWYDGIESIEKVDDVCVLIDLTKKEIQVKPFKDNKQSVTVSFRNMQCSYVINKPAVSFWGCFIFYGTAFTFLVWVIINIINGYKTANKKVLL